MGGKHGSPRDRFLAKVIVNDDGCWGWSACTSRGYGMFSISGTESIQAHRFAWELYNGRKIPSGMQVGHKCHDESDCTAGDDCSHRSCTRPDHLILQNPRDNTLSGRTLTAAFAAATHCQRGHAFDDANTIRFGPDKRWRACRSCRLAAERKRRRLKKGLT